MSLVPKFNGAGIAPFSLGGQSRWTNMMWLEFLFGRPRGVSERLRRRAGRVVEPAVTDMLTKVQDLVKADGFIKGFSSITADSTPTRRCYRQGRDDAARRVDLRQHEADGGDFVSGGHLGYMNFPPVEGGKGDPTSATRASTTRSRRRLPKEKETARKFFSTAVLDDTEISLVEAGSVPIVKGPTPSSRPDTEFLKFIYDVRATPRLSPSRGTRRSPTAVRCCYNIPAVPAVDHPAGVDRQHESSHRQVTTLAPLADIHAPPTKPSGGRVPSPILTWMALPAFLFFLASAWCRCSASSLSFTTWDGIGPISRPA